MLADKPLYYHSFPHILCRFTVIADSYHALSVPYSARPVFGLVRIVSADVFIGRVWRVCPAEIKKTFGLQPLTRRFRSGSGCAYHLQVLFAASCKIYCNLQYPNLAEYKNFRLIFNVRPDSLKF